MHATDIVAYTYQAETLCPRCTIDKCGGTPTDLRIAGSVERLLDRAAYGLKINRKDERTFDSGDFPKVVFADQIEPCEECGGDVTECALHRCDSCGEPLV